MVSSEQVLKSVFEIITNNRKNFNKVSEHSDRIIVWLVGFSITIIALLLSKSELLISARDIVLNLILIYSFVIVFGILYRIFSYLVRHFENKLLMTFEGYISTITNIPSLPNKTILETKQTQEKEKIEIEKVLEGLQFHFNYSKKKLDRIRNHQDSNKLIKKIFWPINHITPYLFIFTISTFLIGILYFIFIILQFKICH
jgi:hypothetical protein